LLESALGIQSAPQLARPKSISRPNHVDRHCNATTKQGADCGTDQGFGRIAVYGLQGVTDVPRHATDPLQPSSAQSYPKIAKSGRLLEFWTKTSDGIRQKTGWGRQYADEWSPKSCEVVL